MGLPITPFIDLLNSVLAAWCSYHLFRSFRREGRKNFVLLYFAQGYFSLIFAYLFFSIPRFVAANNSLVLGIAFIIAQLFLYIAIADFAKVTTFFINVQWVQRVYVLILLMALIATVLSVIFFSYPVYHRSTGITNWNIQPVVGVASLIIFGIVLLPSIFFFFRQGIRSPDSVVKGRSIIIAIGLACLSVTAVTYYSAETQLGALVSDMLSLLSYLIVFFGILYKRKSVLPLPNTTLG